MNIKQSSVKAVISREKFFSLMSAVYVFMLENCLCLLLLGLPGFAIVLRKVLMGFYQAKDAVPIDAGSLEWTL